VRSLIVGTAGHVDHGKSSLVQALTGTDPDRLKEEKQRGITTDLGFAHGLLGEGVMGSFVDVPGHERFVRHMVAGAHGFDAVMLVVAADESVKPQTREHLEICRLLRIPRGLVALSKRDLVGPAALAAVESEVRALVAGSFLDGAPIVPVSVKTGAGLEALRAALGRLAGGMPERPAGALLRLPVDRVFTLRGFGTIVTGTLTSGELAVGEEVEIQPSGLRARVRGLEVHGEALGRVKAGHRTAANLAGVDVNQLVRGDVLTRPGTFRPGSILDVELTLSGSAKPLVDGVRVRVHMASAEVLARVRLLGPRELCAGQSHCAQLRSERPVVAGRGDRLVLRSYSPAETIGGARVLNPVAPRRRSADHGRVAALAALDEADVAGAAALLVAEAGTAGAELGTLAARLTLAPAELPRLLAGTPDLTIAGNAAFSRDALLSLEAKALSVLTRFHAENPLRDAMRQEELKRETFGRTGTAAFDIVLAALKRRPELRITDDAVALAGHAVRLSAEDAAASVLLLESARAAGLAGLELEGLPAPSEAERRRLDRVSRVLLESRQLRRVGTTRLNDAAGLDALVRDVRARFPAGARLDVGHFKEMTGGLSRKFVIPLLEYLDRERVTRRAGSERFVL
jgi:selenocysteine-specific elongation factor